MKNLQFFILANVIALFISCGSSKSTTNRTVNPHAQKHQQVHQEFALQQAQKKLTDDFIAGITGNFLGNIPCADCESIRYELRLHENLSYTLKLMYEGKSEEIIKIEGFYSLADGFMIVLDEKAGNMNYLEKVDKGLLLLDKNGIEIQGELAKTYILERVY